MCCSATASSGSMPSCSTSRATSRRLTTCRRHRSLPSAPRRPILSDLLPGAFATTDGMAVPLDTGGYRRLNEFETWHDMVWYGGPHVASVFLPRVSGLGVMLSPGSVIRSASIARIVPAVRGFASPVGSHGRDGTPATRPLRRLSAHRTAGRGGPGSTRSRSAGTARPDRGTGHLARRAPTRRGLAAAAGPRVRGRPAAQSSRLCSGHATPPVAQDTAGRAPLPPRRRSHPGDHVGDRPLAGHQAPDQGLLGVPRHDHGLRRGGTGRSMATSSSSTGPSSSRAARWRSSARSTRSSAAPTARTTSRPWSCASTR